MCRDYFYVVIYTPTLDVIIGVEYIKAYICRYDSRSRCCVTEMSCFHVLVYLLIPILSLRNCYSILPQCSDVFIMCVPFLPFSSAHPFAIVSIASCAFPSITKSRRVLPQNLDLFDSAAFYWLEIPEETENRTATSTTFCSRSRSTRRWKRRS